MTPNLLFVTLDQLRADVLFGALHGIVPTPALDRLRAEGTSFTQCFTAAVPCGPARASLLTGLYAFNHRGIRNGAPVAAHHATLGTELRRAGIEPLLFGYCDMAADPTGRAPDDPDLATYELPARGFREIVEMRFEAPLAWTGYLRRMGYDLPAPQPERWFDLYRPAGDGRRAPAFYRAEHSDTAFLTDRTLEALEARRDGSWCAHLTYIRPHPPLVAPEPWNRLPIRAAIPAPAPAGSDHPFRKAWVSAPAQHGLFHGFDGRCDRLTPAQVADLRAVYLGLVAEVDHHLGRLLDWLDTTGQAGRTHVVLLSDHGEMLGDQGFWGKDNVLVPGASCSAGLSRPGCGGGHTVADVPPPWMWPRPSSTCWACSIPPAMDGTSLRPFLEAAPRKLGAAPRSPKSTWPTPPRRPGSNARSALIRCRPTPRSCATAPIRWCISTVACRRCSSIGWRTRKNGATSPQRQRARRRWRDFVRRFSICGCGVRIGVSRRFHRVAEIAPGPTSASLDRFNGTQGRGAFDVRSSCSATLTKNSYA